MEKFAKYKDFSKSIRRNIIFMGKYGGSNSAHIGGALSLADIFSVLFSDFFKMTKGSKDNDRIILSKGHACLALYSILYENNIISKEDMKSFEKPESNLLGHPVKNREIAIDFSTGSLGMGLGLGIGLAHAFKKKKIQRKIYVVLGDGECNEGSVWEALMFASHHNLDNLCVIVDYNKIQSLTSVKNTIKIEPLRDKFKSFGCQVVNINGHNFSHFKRAFKSSAIRKPKVIIANTVKGKGVSFMENKISWHYKSPNKRELDLALREIDNA